MTKQAFLVTPDLRRRIFAIAGPMLVANISTPLLGIIDAAILGHLDDSVYLAAAALGAQLVTLVFWSLGFLRMATTGFTARALGEGNKTEIDGLLIQGLRFALIASAAILLINPLLSPLIVKLMATKQELFQLSLQYTELRFWSAPATLTNYVMIGWLIGLQKTRSAMIIIVCINALNIMFDYVLIVTFDMKTAGAAWATLVSEYIGCFLAFLLIKKHFEYLSTPFKWRNFFHSPTNHLAYFRASQHLFIRTLCLLACFTFFAAQGARFGSDVVAANAILLSLLALTALMMDAFAYAAETLGGEAWGKNKQNEFRAIVVATWYLATLIAIACCAVLLLWKEPIISLYTDIPAVITETTKQYLWLAWMPLLAIHSYQLDGIFIGIGKTRAMQNAMLAASILVFLPACLTIGTDNNSGLWLSFWLFQSARLIFLAPCLFLILRRSSSLRKQL